MIQGDDLVTHTEPVMGTVVSFALQALCVELLVRRAGELGAGVHAVPDEIDREVGRLKLAALGVRIDSPTAEQTDYRQSWS